jgi:hypothetical protein
VWDRLTAPLRCAVNGPTCNRWALIIEISELAMKERKRITEITVKESAEIHSILPNDDGAVSLIDSQGNKVAHEQSDSVGYLRDSGKAKILRSIVRGAMTSLVITLGKITTKLVLLILIV